jgi:nucleoside-diphosphate kinase
MERTLVILKPDTLQRAIVGEVIARFERAGLKIVGMKMVAPDEKHFHEHYEGISKLISRWGQEIYNVTMAQMTDGPVLALVLEGIEATAHVRKMVGATDPKEAAPGTIRGDYTHIARAYTNARGSTMPNLIHASGNPEEAAAEIKLWFRPSELYEYKNVHEAVVYGRIPG